MKKLLTLGLLTFSLSTLACGPNSLPERYVAAIESRDADKMAAFMADQIHYQDPTMTYFKIPAIDLKGRDATTKFWRDSFRDAEVIGLDYTITDCFQAGPVFMVDLQLSMEVAGSS